MMRLALLLLAGTSCLLSGCASDGAGSGDGSEPEEAYTGPLLPGSITMTSTYEANRGEIVERRNIRVEDGRVLVTFDDGIGNVSEGEGTPGAWAELWDQLLVMDPFARDPDLIVEGPEPGAEGPYHRVELVRGEQSHTFSAQLRVVAFGIFVTNDVSEGLSYTNRIVDFVRRFAPLALPTEPEEGEAAGG